MSTATLAASAPAAAAPLPQLDNKPGRMTVRLFVALLVGGASYTAASLNHLFQ